VIRTKKFPIRRKRKATERYRIVRVDWLSWFGSIYRLGMQKQMKPAPTSFSVLTILIFGRVDPGKWDE
jgi:hypothetical protein